MTFQITGKNIDLGEALKSYILERLNTSIDKFTLGHLSGHVRLEKVRTQFLMDCSIQLKSGLVLHSHGEAVDPYACADSAFERLEKRLRRYKRRLKNHTSNYEKNRQDVYNAYDYVIQQHDEPDVEPQENENATDEDLAPTIVAETAIKIYNCSVGDAVMKLDLSNKPFVVFQNASNGLVNIVYKRDDGHIGWIDPSNNIILD